jgi:multiple sugar transport system ATP-binding protein
MADVQLNGVSKSFAKTQAISDMDLTVPDGAFVVLLGPTGAGKTTTLRLIAGLEKADTGSISIGGASVDGLTPAQRDVAMVFQQYSLYPHMSVRENLAFPLRSPILKTPQQEIEHKVQQVAEVLHIEHKLNNKATMLSGGEMQRVSIGRALVRDPAIFLMDEPLSSLDAKLRADLRIELKRIHAELNATLLYVTHDQIEAMTMSTHVGVLDEGRLVQFGKPREIYENPCSTYVAARLGQPRINLLPVGLLQDNAPSNAVTVGLRPENISLSGGNRNSAIQTNASQNNATGREATIRRVEHLGDQTRLHLTLNEHDIVTLTDPQEVFMPGESIRVNAHKPLFFDAQGDRVN